MGVLMPLIESLAEVTGASPDLLTGLLIGAGSVLSYYLITSSGSSASSSRSKHTSVSTPAARSEEEHPSASSGHDNTDHVPYRRDRLPEADMIKR